MPYLKLWLGVSILSEETLSSKSYRKIFISHRHDDNKIASSLRKQLQSWGIPEDCIFQSSSNSQAGKVGRPIKQEIKRFLEQAKLVILIYTHPELNWDYCMYECGLATDPATVQTNVIVFQCTSNQPRVFRDELLIVTDADGIKRFTHQFHQKDDFFPGLPAYDPDLGIEGMDIRSTSLLDSLKPFLPSQETRNDIRWGYFTLLLPPEVIRSIKEPNSIHDSYRACMKDHMNITVVDAAGWGLRHFGYQENEPGLSLNKVIGRWKSKIEEYDDSGNENEDWISELNMEVCRSVRNDPPQISWAPLKSVYPHINWYVCPVINEVRYKADGNVELVIFMYRVDMAIEEDRKLFRMKNR